MSHPALCRLTLRHPALRRLAFRAPPPVPEDEALDILVGYEREERRVLSSGY